MAHAVFRQMGGNLLRGTPSGAQAASRHRFVSPIMIGILAAVLAAGGLATQPQRAEAATLKVVVVVGPTGSETARYIGIANQLATQAASYGARVIKVYSPYASWARVKYYAQGANLFIYLGHGNGWPSPYSPYQTYTKDGLGLNSYSGSGNYNHKYYGERYVPDLHLAPNAVVLLSHLCYASGTGEEGMSNPTLTVARQRVDNYGAGFLRAGARAVFAESLFVPSFVIYSLFKTSRSMSQIFYSAPNATKTYASSFYSTRTPGKRALLDPYQSRYNFRRSLIGDLSMTAATWR